MTNDEFQMPNEILMTKAQIFQAAPAMLARIHAARNYVGPHAGPSNPGEGIHNGRVGNAHKPVSLFQRWKKFSLSLGERAGVGPGWGRGEGERELQLNCSGLDIRASTFFRHLEFVIRHLNSQRC